MEEVHIIHMDLDIIIIIIEDIDNKLKIKVIN